ncbi:MAG TPA: alpha/beta fold hydrolase [Burkholderiales bacterium]
METIHVGPAPRLAVSVAGEGTLLLFLHGIRGNRRNWTRQLEFFSRHFKAAAWDARGYGDSEDYEGALRFDEDFSADLLRVADHFKAGTFHLVGLSMGGRIARNFALRHPERLRSLVLAGTSPGFEGLDAKRFVAERRTATPESVRRLLGSRALASAYENLLDSVQRVHQASFEKTLEASVAQDRAAPLEQIRVPTLVITGDEDSVYPPAMARDIARRIPGAGLVVMNGVGHLSNLEQPEEFNQAVLQFLKHQEKHS